MEQFSAEVRQDAGWTIVVARGQLDVATAPGFRQTLQEVQYGGGVQVALDLSELEFLDSFGLGVVVGGLKRARTHDGDLVVVVGDGRIRHLFEVTGLDAVIRLAGDLAAVTDG